MNVTIAYDYRLIAPEDVTSFPGVQVASDTHSIWVSEQFVPKGEFPGVSVLRNLEVAFLILPTSDDGPRFRAVSIDGKVVRVFRKGQHQGHRLDCAITHMPLSGYVPVNKVAIGDGFLFDGSPYMSIATQPAKTDTVWAVNLNNGLEVDFDLDAIVEKCSLTLDLYREARHLVT